MSLSRKYRLNFPVLVYFRTPKLLMLFCFVKHLHKLGLREAALSLGRFSLSCFVLLVILNKSIRCSLTFTLCCIQRIRALVVFVHNWCIALCQLELISSCRKQRWWHKTMPKCLLLFVAYFKSSFQRIQPHRFWNVAGLFYSNVPTILWKAFTISPIAFSNVK